MLMVARCCTIRLTRLVLLLVLGFAGPEPGRMVAAAPQAPEATPEQVGLDPAKLDAIETALREAIAREAIPGAVVGVGRFGKLAYVKALGDRAVQPDREPMTRDTIFDLASLTKPIATASSILSLIHEGKLKTTDRVADHLPEFAPHGKEVITVDQLLRHRAGLIADNPLEDYEHGPEAAWKAICDLTPIHPPGERFVYTDVGFIVLGKLVEKLDGRPLDQAAAARVFGPLGMSDARFNPDQTLQGRIAPTEEERGVGVVRGVVHDPRARLMGGVAGHAGLFGTVDDLAAYASALTGLLRGEAQAGRGWLTPEEARTMIDPADTPPNQRRGLGWDISTPYSSPRGDLFGPASFGHTGFTGTSVWIDPESDLFVILLTSRLHPRNRGNINPIRSQVATLAASAVISDPRPDPGPVACGIDRLLLQGGGPLVGKRVGLVTNHTGRTRDGRATIDALRHLPGVDLVALFSPEHGIRGEVDREVDDGRDERTGLPIFSLYGKTRKPTPESLKGVEILVYDLQDIGTRFYTYISTLKLVMKAAAEAGLPLVVLDRPNPIGGVEVAGPVRDPRFDSFIACHALPVRHGMTVGELARMFNEEDQIGTDLTVIPCQGWRRSMLWDQTGLEWVNPSPNMRSLTEALLYPGVGLLEATNLATGRGTDTPFERIGAPWIEPRRLARALNDLKLPGVVFVPIRFTPSERQYAGETCGGVFLQITNRDQFEPISLAIGLAIVLNRLYPRQWDSTKLQGMVAHQATLEAISQGRDLAQIPRLWDDDLDEFQARRARFLISGYVE
ncbi:Uncharacterized conserved protein UCP016719 [Isosphaera pallida ATCC 43644]|uniref:Uncharacterized conserved protein UCP016719 n=1 Tax=Isosphaera pallida (strain ATCC 43644 / DSM 9630 / IS1B) TaxID=575540 RepID=E8R579_ISOPI|nr:exo-beta-N-acetylmuramidase NamZ domain-containing protein [Isosphaera pallida]ADV63832.1 Uncharacterized conserved protein UCP016719 [Isosphaera pallida ATCC 43644]